MSIVNLVKNKLYFHGVCVTMFFSYSHCWVCNVNCDDNHFNECYFSYDLGLKCVNYPSRVCINCDFSPSRVCINCDLSPSRVCVNSDFSPSRVCVSTKNFIPVVCVTTAI